VVVAMSITLPSRILRLRNSHQPFESTPQCIFSAYRSQCLRNPETVHRVSTTSIQCRDNNRVRGLSAIRRSGLRGKRLAIKPEDLPVPVLDAAKRTKLECDPDHGLWGFFNREKTLLATPEEDSQHGRNWTVHELRRKSWDDLHCLWWLCIKERNRLATEQNSRLKLRAGYGEFESTKRVNTIKETQKAIMHTLTERFYAWEDARDLALQAPDIAVRGDNFIYRG